ncbi:MAG TPA: Si-specific NAD(P)(+) transhydrogenase [Longimicrobiales bacterium]|nr:Si-specific NAD(P)(+) transhydrogenase [Longimicrobiales bacterium]
MRYDLVVIGSGPAGEKGAAQAAYFGKRVAIVESSAAMGGAAANTGTLPSKTLRETSLVLSGFRARGLYGVDLSLRREATVGDFLFREKVVVEAERKRAIANVARHHIDTYHGFGTFVDPHTIKVKGDFEDTILESDVVLIATGSSPRRPLIFPFDAGNVFDSDTILGLRKMPRTLAVVGGGVIGCEYACTFAALGIEVTLIDGGDRVLRFMDPEVSATLRAAMEKLGVSFYAPDRVEKCDSDRKRVSFRLESGRMVYSDAALIAAGRIANTDKLNLEAAGLLVDRDGTLEVDLSFRTSVSHIYGAGDVIGFPALASTSMEQARLAMVAAFDLKYKKEVAPILPYGVYTIPEASMAGETEETLRKKGVAYVTGRASYSQNSRGIIIGDNNGFLKLIFGVPDMKLLGVHIIGEQASELLHIGLTAMLTGADSDLFIRTCYNYPTLSEMYKYATYDAMGRMQRGEISV